MRFVYLLIPLFALIITGGIVYLVSTPVSPNVNLVTMTATTSQVSPGPLKQVTSLSLANSPAVDIDQAFTGQLTYLTESYHLSLHYLIKAATIGLYIFAVILVLEFLSRFSNVVFGNILVKSIFSHMYKLVTENCIFKALARGFKRFLTIPLIQPLLPAEEPGPIHKFYKFIFYPLKIFKQYKSFDQLWTDVEHYVNLGYSRMATIYHFFAFPFVIADYLLTPVYVLIALWARWALDRNTVELLAPLYTVRQFVIIYFLLAYYFGFLWFFRFGRPLYHLYVI